MGNNNINSTSQSLNVLIDHYKLSNSTLVTCADKTVLKVTIQCDEQAYKIWKKSL